MSTNTQGGHTIPIVPLPIGTGKSYNVANIKHQKSIMKNWCWAATIAMVLERINPGRFIQCRIVGLLYPNTQCCQPQPPSTCDQFCKINDIENIYKSNGIKGASIKRGQLPFDGPSSLEFEIKNDRPVKVGWNIPGTTQAHVVIVHETHSYNGTQTVSICDPKLDASALVTFDELKQPLSGELWTWTWTGLG